MSLPIGFLPKICTHLDSLLCVLHTCPSRFFIVLFIVRPERLLRALHDSPSHRFKKIFLNFFSLSVNTLRSSWGLKVT